MPTTASTWRTRRRLVPVLAAVTALWGSALFVPWHAGAASPAAIIDTGGSVLSHRGTSATGALGVTFGFGTGTLAGGPYQNQGSTIYNYPLYAANTATTAEFWLDYVEELVSAGVDFVAVDTRGFMPGSSVPNQGGDPRGR
jgi:hypothetical protein